MNADTMRPIRVRDLLSCGERLGMTHCSVSPCTSGSVSRVRIHPWESEGVSVPLPHTIVIFPSTAPDRKISAADVRRLPPLFHRTISCAAFSEAGRLPDALGQFYQSQKVPVFTSSYDAALLRSRLIGLIREKGMRQTQVHGVLIRLSGKGVLMTGDSGIGKTACSLELVKRGAHWIADDAVVLEGRGDALYGRGHHRTKRWIAVRSRGILAARTLLGDEAICEETRVDAIIRFVRHSEKEGNTEAGDRKDSIPEIVGVPVPCRCLAAGHSPRRMAGQVREALGELLLGKENRRAVNDRVEASACRTGGSG